MPPGVLAGAGIGTSIDQIQKLVDAVLEPGKAKKGSFERIMDAMAEFSVSESAKKLRKNLMNIINIWTTET